MISTGGTATLGLYDYIKNHSNLSGRDTANSHPASAILDSSGLNQQTFNNNLFSGKVLFSSFGAKTIEQVPDFDCTAIFQTAMLACAQAKNNFA